MRGVLNLVLCYQIISSLAFGITGLSGENKCKLENGDQGVCALLSFCREAMENIGKVDVRSWELSTCVRVAFDNIVCCPVDIWNVTWSRPAERACQEYRKQYYSIDQKQRQKNLNENRTQDVEFPYVVAVGYKINDNNEGARRIQYRCGGILLSDEYVLTAAHCVAKIRLKPFEVLLGVRELNSTNGVTIPIEEITIHPYYTDSNFYNDLAIIKLKTKVQMTQKIKPICLQTQPFSNVNLSFPTSLSMSGWSSGFFLVDDGSLPLIITNNPEMVDLRECRNLIFGIANSKLPVGIINTHVCGVLSDLERSVISGASLSIVTEFEDTLAGILSFGHPGLDIYITVYPYLDWIEKKVWPTLN